MKKKIFLTSVFALAFSLTAVAQYWGGSQSQSSKIYRTGIVGIGLTNPPSDTRLYVKASNLKVGIVSEVSHNSDHQFGILSAVNRSKTKALSVLLREGTSNYVDTFAVMGDGTVLATEVNVQVPIFPDYVFEKNYNLPTLKEVEEFIDKNGHLKGVPSAKEVSKKGINLGEMDTKLLQKIEELMLYTIQQQKEIEKLKLLNVELQKEMKK